MVILGHTHTILPLHLTMFGCSNSFNNDISLMAVEGTPSHSLRGTQVMKQQRALKTLTYQVLSF